MTTDTDDRLPVPHFTASLWAELAELHGQRRHSHDHDHDLGRSAGDLVTVDRRHRLRGRRSLYAGAGAIAAAAALVAAVAGQQDAGGEPQLGTLIVAATRQASDEKILHAVTDVIRPRPASEAVNGGNFDREEWSNWEADGHDAHTTHSEQDGTLVYEEGGKYTAGSDDGRPTDRRLNHVDHTYREDCLGVSPIYGSGEQFAELIRDELDEGVYFEDGTEVVDGEELIVVRVRDADDRGEWLRSSRSAIYVDRVTYLPRLDRHYGEDGDLDMEVTFEYLPRTPENLAKTLPPPVPPTYTKVPMPDDNC